MLVILLFLIITEGLSLTVLRQHLFSYHRITYYFFLLVHLVLSIWLWLIFIAFADNKGFFDEPDNIWNLTTLAGLMCSVVIPRTLLIIFHYSGKLSRLKTTGHIRWLTNTGFAVAGIIFIVTVTGTLRGRFNYKFENIPVEIKGLPEDLEGLKLVQISDLHLSGFYHHGKSLENVMKKISDLNPDLLFNTGDFVTFGWRELGRNDTILSKAHSKYGSFAILGNHDAGTYHPYFTEADKRNNVLLIRNFIGASGFKLLENEFTKVKVGNTVIAIIGVTTSGRHPDIVHGDIDQAMAGLDSSDFRILLTHDPNHWLEKVAGKRNDLNLTLSGHTHGMQMGIITRGFKWSPSKYFYPDWNGLYSNGDQYQYVNRGLGVLAIPFRIWMPPEITILTLHKKK